MSRFSLELANVTLKGLLPEGWTFLLMLEFLTIGLMLDGDLRSYSPLLTICRVILCVMGVEHILEGSKTLSELDDDGEYS